MSTGKPNQDLGARKWGEFYKTHTGNVYPDENLLRLVKGRYPGIPDSGRVLDVGFGIGGNLALMADLGFEAHGLEVSEESIRQADRLSEERGLKLHLGLIKSTRLEYPEDHFDIVVSWNAVYYWGSRTSVQEAIREFRRVLRPEGVLLMTVIHPNCFMHRRLSDDLGDGRRKIDRPATFDNREGLEIFYDPTSSGWRNMLSDFSSVQEGYSECDLFNPDKRLAFRIFLARK